MDKGKKIGHIYIHIVFVYIFILIFEFILIYLLYVLFVLKLEINFGKRKNPKKVKRGYFLYNSIEDYYINNHFTTIQNKIELHSLML